MRRCLICGADHVACLGGSVGGEVAVDDKRLRFGSGRKVVNVLIKSGGRMRDANRYTSSKRLYLDRDGNVVKDGDPNRHMLLVSKGGSISMDKARKYGLVGSEDGESGDDVNSETVEAKATDAAPENKAIASPAENKSTKKAGRKGTKKAAK